MPDRAICLTWPICAGRSSQCDPKARSRNHGCFDFLAANVMCCREARQRFVLSLSAASPLGDRLRPMTHSLPRCPGKDAPVLHLATGTNNERFSLFM